MTTGNVKIRYNPDGDAHRAPWVVTDGPLTVHAAGWSISSELLQLLSDDDWKHMHALRFAPITLTLEGRLSVHDINGRPFAYIHVPALTVRH